MLVFFQENISGGKQKKAINDRLFEVPSGFEPLYELLQSSA